MGVINSVPLLVDEAGAIGVLSGFDKEYRGCRQRFFPFSVFFRMEVDIVLFKKNTGDLVVLAAAGKLGFWNGKGDHAAGFGRMRRLDGFDAELPLGAGVFDGFEVRSRLWMPVFVMGRVWLVMQDKPDRITFGG